MATERTYLVREVPQEDADEIPKVIAHLRSEGHFIADVQHAGSVWHIYGRERRFRVAEPDVLLTFRRRATD